MRRLHPGPPADTTVRALYDVERRRHADGRPWVGLCMVASLDGSTAVHGTSAALSCERDSEVLLTLRRLADVIVVGAGTVRAEGYGEPATPGQRVGVVTASGDVDLTGPLFTSGAGFLICTTATPANGVDTLRVGSLPAGDETGIETGIETGVDLAEALRRLPEIVPDVGFVHVEGGTTLNGALVAADLVDELHLTVSPKMVGGTGPRVAAGRDDGVRGFELAHLAIDADSFVYTRWLRRD